MRYTEKQVIFNSLTKNERIMSEIMIELPKSFNGLGNNMATKNQPIIYG